jgi:S1-C subfamily serine protease
MELVPLTEELGSYFGTDDGLLVIRAPNNDDLDLRDGDVILAIGGREPTSPEHAMRILTSFVPGETLEFSIMRRERRQSIQYAIPGRGSEAEAKD